MDRNPESLEALPVIVVVFGPDEEGEVIDSRALRANLDGSVEQDEDLGMAFDTVGDTEKDAARIVFIENFETDDVAIEGLAPFEIVDAQGELSETHYLSHATSSWNASPIRLVLFSNLVPVGFPEVAASVAGDHTRFLTQSVDAAFIDDDAAASLLVVPVDAVVAEVTFVMVALGEVVNLEITRRCLGHLCELGNLP
jgi:hypothetical protein